MRVYFFKIELAGLKFEVECYYKHVFYICRKYLSHFEKPNYVIRASEEEIREETLRTLGDVAGSEYDPRIATEYVDSESKVILRKIADVLIESNCLLIHGAAIEVEGRCFIFTADSGTGKTTHILNWLKKVPGTIVVNGDKPFIDYEKKIVYGSPWSGKEGMNTNISSRLSGIILLERGEQNIISEIRFKELLPTLIQQTYLPAGINPVKGYQLLGQLKDIPCYRLICNMEEESAVVAYNGLFRKNG